ncbi:MAG: hypothetical protein HOP08_15690 [Cyclobacteriaceae bacterium]|nr:hypothetical protein [Cyclobacteriaceae bacterium]
MSILKVVLIVIAVLVVLFILLLVYTLSPTIRDISKHEELKAFVEVPLIIRSPAFIYKSDKGSYRFHEYVLTQNEQYQSSMTHELVIGSKVMLKKIKTYRSDGGAGFTDVFALGEYIAPDGKKIEFEYIWGNIDPGLYSGIVEPLPGAPWQDSTAAPIRVKRN